MREVHEGFVYATNDTGQRSLMAADPDARR